MANDNWTAGGEEPIDILDDDLLEETELSMEDDEGGFEEESTQIYQPGEHDSGGFEEEATRVFDPGTDEPEEFEDESTRIWQTEPEPAPIAAAAPVAGAYTTQLPRHGVANLAAASASASGGVAEQSTVITDSTVLYPNQARKQVARPSPGDSGQLPRQSGDERQSKLLTTMIVLAGFALLAVLGAIFLRSGPADTGTVAVLTTPVGAAVILEGERLALTTPTTLSDLEVGRSYSLQLELDGFRSITDTLVVVEGLSQRIFELEAATGSVVVRTVPEGASVSVDGIIRGTSPVTVEGLDPTKPHQIVASNTGYEDVTRNVTFEGDGAREELVTMTLTPTGGIAALAGSPAVLAAVTPPAGEPGAAVAAQLAVGATITVGANGQLVGPDGELILGPDGQPLTTTAWMTAPPTVTPPEAEPEAEPEVPVAEPPAAATSSRSSESSRSSDSGRSSRSAETSRSSRSSRSDDSSRSSRDRPSSRSSRSDPPSRERPSAARPAEPEPEPEPAGDGSLSVQAVPYGQVWIDGRMVAPETPLIGHDLSSGVHRVKVYFVGMRTFSDERSVRIEVGQNRTITFRAER